MLVPEVLEDAHTVQSSNLQCHKHEQLDLKIPSGITSVGSSKQKEHERAT